MQYDLSDQTKWFASHLLPMIGIVIAAVVAIYIGEIIIKLIVRRSVHGRHVGRTNQSIVDVRKRQDTIAGVSRVIWKILVFVASSFALFSVIFPEVNLVPVLASAGILTAVVGFGAQSIIRDFIAGAFIIIENQFRVGDEVEIEGAVGKVEHITLRSTVVRDDGGNAHYIANGNIMHVINKTMGYSKVYFTLSVDPTTNIDKLSEIIEKIGKKMASEDEWKAKILESPKILNLGNFSDSAVEVRVTGKTQPGDQFSVSTEFKKRLLLVLKSARDIKLSQYQDVSRMFKSK